MGRRKKERKRQQEELLRRQEELLRDPTLHRAAAVGFGFACAAGLRSPQAGLLIMALFALYGALRSFLQSRWLVACLLALTLAGFFVPQLAILMSLATVGLLIFRVGFVIAHFNVIAFGLVAYALLLSGIFFGPLGAVVVAGPGRVVDPEIVRWILAALLACAGMAFLSAALDSSYGSGYTTVQALEIMAILPLLVVASALPFVDHEVVLVAVQAAEPPNPARLLRVPPTFLRAIELARTAVRR
jgi:hypothetical protein